MKYPVPIRIEIYWHPGDGELCRPLAEAVYAALNRDPSNPALPGLGIPVRFYTTLEPQVDPAAPERLLRLVLVASSLVLSDTWTSTQARMKKEDALAPDRRITVLAGLAERHLGGPLLGVDLSADKDKARALIDLTILQCCRLISGRISKTSSSIGVAPLKLFVSHTKRDPFGRTLATKLVDALREIRTEQFFDEYTLQPGDALGEALNANISDAALIAIRTNSYMSSPWCRKEVAFAKQARRPIIVVDALTGTEARSSPLLAHLPTIRVDPEDPSAESIARFETFTGLEVLRFLHADLVLESMRRAEILPKDCTLLVRPPDLHDLAGITAGNVVVAYPDPALTLEEAEHLQNAHCKLITPTAAWGRILDGRTIGISIGGGDDADLLRRGLSRLHVTDATRVIARVLLTAGASLVYGGALELAGPTDKGENLVSALFQMIDAYNRHGAPEFPPLINYSAWPFWHGHQLDWLAAHMNALRVDRLQRPDGAENLEELSLPDIVTTARGRAYIGISLAQMRQRIAKSTQAQVFLGGAIDNFLGLMPGLLEEVVLTMDDRPIYLLGGFGGASAAVVEALEGGHPEVFTEDWQKARKADYGETLEALRAMPNGQKIDYDAMVAKLNTCGVEGIADRNGLSIHENRQLWATRELDFAIYLVMTGLNRVWGSAG